jgi:hypothetical protein
LVFSGGTIQQLEVFNSDVPPFLNKCTWTVMVVICH